MTIAPGELRTARLVLTPLAVDDAAAMLEVLADPELYSFTGGLPPTLSDLNRRYAALVAGSGHEDEVWLNWIMRLGDGGPAIGFVQATVIGDGADLAWVVGVDWQGTGLAKEAAAAMANWLVRAGIRRLSAHIHPDHKASQHVAASLGMGATGETDEEGEQIWSSGPPHDQVLG